ncbi:protein SPT2 homolog [Athalia rosae]|uniref:protein SPT2 homolog n=1 Tax=Athalia rosae TaxID=37344 RepID=UPI002033D5A1|nr:protein SPT2 homolog [Athalia rosae]
MDFGTLLSVAQKNGGSKQQVAYYPSKFTPPKKESKSSKNLSSNIKKFLAKKEEEERQKALDAKKRKENLLALRDHKAQSRINKHLKVCKSANKSVLADAIDNDNTALTMAGPSQPDEDDYGYVSQEASAFYNQLMNKYNNMPQEKPLFSESGKKTVKDIATTKNRVRQALKQQEIEESSGHRRKRKSQVTGGEKETTSEPDIKSEKEKLSLSEKDKDEKPKPKRRPLPPPMDFMQLLQIAEKKQHEPIVLDVKPKSTKAEEPERLMTKKQMREHLKEREWRERKEQRDRGQNVVKTSSLSADSAKSTKQSLNKIPKLNGTKGIQSSSSPEKSSAARPASAIPKKPVVSDKNNSMSKSLEKDQLLEERKKIEAEKKMLEEMRRSIEEEKKKLALSKSKKIDDKPVSNGSISKSVYKSKPLEKTSATDSKLRQALKSDVKSRQCPPTDSKPKQFPPADLKPRQFPPSDVRPLRPKQFPPKDVKRKPILKKRRIYDDDSEHDSELDDFIDDGPEEGAEDYSKYISEIFGYDKNKYRDIDDDDAAMESNFAQQLKEEFVSTKIGIMEDLEDIRMEALEKKRKAMIKNKKPRS